MKRLEFGLSLTSFAIVPDAAHVATAGSVPSPDHACTASGKHGHGRGSFAHTEEFAAGPKAIDPAALAGTTLHPSSAEPPSRFVLSSPPPVAQQYGLQSCEAHAFGYGLCGYTAGRGAPALEASALPSRAWLFARELKIEGRPCSKGTFALGYLEQMTAYGAPTEAAVPYCPDCSYIEKIRRTLDHYPVSDALRIGSYRTIVIHSMERQLPIFKTHLANGQAIAFSGRYGKDYEDPALQDGVYYADAGFIDADHGQLLVGYDDSKGKHGAFLVQNSYGTDWPKAAPGGRVWWDYETFFSSQTCGAIAYPARGGPPSGRPLHASIKGAPAATISSVRAVPYSKGNYDLIVVHEFAAPIHMRELTVTPPRGEPLKSSTAMTVSNGYSVIASARPWHGKTKRAYELRIDARSRDAGEIVYTGTIMV